MAADRRRERHEALARLLEADGLDALLVTSRPNIRYLTGFGGSAGVVVATHADLLLVTDFRYDEQARLEAGGRAGGAAAGAQRPGRGRGDPRGGRARGRSVAGDARGGAARPNRAGDRRRVGRSAAARRQRGPSVPDDRGVGPAHRAAPRADQPARRGGGGVAAARLRRRRGRLLRGHHAHGRRRRGAQRRAREGVRAAMPGREADALAREPIEARGFGDAFGHSTGHGLGLEVHEAPRLARSALEPLPEDAVVTIEPGVYVPGRGGVRIEDDVHLSARGPVLLSDGRTDLVE